MRSRKFLITGITSGIGLWVIDAVVDGLFFRHTDVWVELVHPHPVEASMRTFVIVLCAFIGWVIDYYERNREIKSVILSREVERRKRIQRKLNNYVEEERFMISREIHDDFAQLLTVIKMQVRLLQARGSHDKELEEINGTVDELVKRTRNISNSLRPMVLEHFGLSEAIKWLAAETKKSAPLTIELLLKEGADAMLNDEARLSLFRVVQEALTNIARHSGAQHAGISLMLRGDKVQLHIYDDGKGIEPQKINDAETLGLINMRERIELLQGDFSIAQHNGRGVMIKASVPVKTGFLLTQTATFEVMNS